MRITLADIKASRIPQALGVCSTDARVLQYVNEAQQRLITQGLWWSCWGRYRIATTAGLLVWPRQIASILAGSVEWSPIPLRDQWFEFIRNCWGIRDSTENPQGDWNMIDRGMMCSWVTINGDDKRIKVYADVIEDDDAQILLLGYDENGNWIRTLQDGVMADGELVDIDAAAPATSTHYFTSLTDVQKPITNGTVRLYMIDDTAAETALATYEHDETRPSYRVTYIPALDCNNATETKTVEVVAKLEHIPMRLDTDYALIACIPALKDMAVAVKTSEEEPTMTAKAQAIAAGLAMAKDALNAEIRHYEGQPVKVYNAELSAGTTGETIENFL